MEREYKKAQNLEEKATKKERPINLAEIWFRIVDMWYLFAIVLVSALIIAFVVNRYSASRYESSATLLLKTNNDVLNTLDMQKGIMWSNSEKDFQNAIRVLQSYSIARETVKGMNLYCSYYQRINFRDVDIYKDSPFEVIPDLNTPQPTGIKIGIRLLNDKKCEISYSGKQGVSMYDYMADDEVEQRQDIKTRDVVLNYGDWYNKDGMHFKVLLKKDKWSPKFARVDYSFTMNNFKTMAYAYRGVGITRADDGSSIINISFQHENPQMAVDFVNTLCNIYIDQSFKEKNYLNVTTIDFVNQQLASIGDSLTQAEARKEAFQETHNTLNLTNDGQYLYEKTNELQQKRAEAYTRQKYYDYLEDYIEKAALDQGVASPSVMGVEDPVLTNLVKELSDVIILHKSALTKGSAKNPKTKDLELKIQTIRKQIAESLRNLQTVSSISRDELQRQQNELQYAINRLPSTERNMVNIQRQFKFNDQIYSFLYQKRSEAEIAKNAALPDHRVIDKAMTASKIYPKTAKNLIIALVLGLLLPAIYIIAKYLLKDTLSSKDDLVNISERPIIGYIPQFHDGANPMMVFNRPKSQITESYRTVRTNIKYILGQKTDEETHIGDAKVILTTSSMPSEGKTLTSLNIASVFSISSNKTLLMEYDLRKPRLHKSLGLDPIKGITSYYIGQHTPEEIVQKTEFDNLDVVCVGQVPPNPSEIIDSEKNRQLIATLKKQYDYIIIDTPPISLIADAQTLAKEADISLFVVRVGVTSMSILRTAIQEMEERGGKNLYFILNDIQNIMQKYGYGKGSYGYGYGYGYGRNYGYGYGNKYSYTNYSYGYFEDESGILRGRLYRNDSDEDTRVRSKKRTKKTKRLDALRGASKELFKQDNDNE